MKRQGICTVCGCVQSDACEEGCGWANREQTLCTACKELSPTARAQKREQALEDLAMHHGQLHDEQREIAARMDVLVANPIQVRTQPLNRGGTAKRSQRQKPRYPSGKAGAT